MIPPPMEKTFPVTVTNMSAKEVVGRLDGQEYRFPKKTPVTVPNDVARHILGYDLDAKGKELVAIALGWSRESGDMPAALTRLKEFRFDPEEGTRLSLSPEPARVPLNSPKSDGGKLLLAPAA